MTNEEAIVAVLKAKDIWYRAMDDASLGIKAEDAKKNIELLEVLENAVGKQIPKKTRRKDRIEPVIGFLTRDDYCPACNRFFDWETPEYCDACGQRLDWS